MDRFRLLVVGVFLVVASACRVDGTVEIAVDDDGSGVVTVTVEADAAAAAALAEDPDRLRLDDLEAAGWEVAGPEADTGGGFTVSAQKEFGSADALPDVLAEIAGEGVVFRDIELVRDHSFPMIGIAPATTDYSLTGTVDPTPDLTVLGSEVLEPPLGRTIDDGVLAGSAATDDVVLADALRFNFVVSMPSDVTAEPEEGAVVDDDTVTWTFAYGDEEVDVLAEASVEDLLPRVWAIVALLAFLAALLLFATRLGALILARIRTPKGRRRRDVKNRQKRAETRDAEANRPRTRLLRLLVVDVHGVVVRPTDPVEGLLLPLVTSQEPDIDPDTVRDRHRQLILGRISPEEFWSELGLGPVAEEMETRYLSSFRLVPGLHPFLDRMSASQLPVAAVGNQPAVWGQRLRRMAALEGVVASWLVSGDVGAALPEPPLFEATRRTLSVDLYDCFYLSSVIDHLDAAKELGMATGYFAPTPEDLVSTSHTVIRGFDDLLRSRGG